MSRPLTPDAAEVLRLDGVAVRRSGRTVLGPLGSGRAVAAGRIESALASGPLSPAFGRPLVVERSGGRFAARGASAS
jgi:hypothetical protein